MNRLGSRIAAGLTIAAGVSFAALVGGVGGSSANHYGAANRAPDCTNVQPSLQTLNATGKLIKVSLSGATDPDPGETLTYTITGVTQDEPVIGPPGTTSPDAVKASDTNAVLLRAELDPRGDGRVYEISFTVSDGGASCSGVVQVAVPPRKKGEKAVDSGQAYDSFTGDPL